ncbi:oxidoreductase [Spirosoma linguale]|uniref:Short-chain dehydrogenase/reductase SDR n=1 Tax=Spirosoma linguale (strain ATCC 33905 / DSM 74 / LMG 10896 / Claus 1) TaxID=504472 RepID=D2QMX2_SPILD|nr:short-chain dehydrogenase/reductase SDR [Spirosoma linguale DSM 74]
MSKVILITGASSGIGKETAKKLIIEGHKVYVAARRIDQMQDLQLAGGIALPLDITNEENIQQVVDIIIGREGKIDVLFNNAGYAIYGSVEEIPIQEARRQFEVNVFGLASLTQKVIPFMREARSGTIINSSSMGGKMYTPMGAWYHASKHAIEGWSDCLRLELSPFNIHVVILEPGLIATEFSDVMSGPMVARSGSGPYANIVKGVASSASMAMSPASVIAKTVSTIVGSRKPKTRYRVGNRAKPMVWMRVNLGDRLFDKIIMSQVK